jgi:hypothetical protein
MRYGADGVAVVLDGRDMLVMANRREPFNCKR